MQLLGQLILYIIIDSKIISGYFYNPIYDNNYSLHDHFLFF